MSLLEYDDLARHDIEALMDTFELSEEDAIKEYEESKKVPFQEDVFNEVLADGTVEVEIEEVEAKIEDKAGFEV